MDLYQHCQPASLELNEVCWGATAQADLLHSINLKIAAGELLAVVGANGSGKTSLLRCLYRINQPRSGQVLIDGQDLWSLSPRQAAQRIATVLQDSCSEFGLTVFEMVEIGLTPRSQSWRTSQADNALIEQAMQLMQIQSLAARQFAHLSGGERQRVMIARALVQRPDVLILDEPTNHLDIRHQLEMLAILAQLPCTVVVSLHDLSFAASYADRVLLMQQGRMLACCTPKNVLTQQRIKQSFAVQALIDQHPMTERPRFSFYL